MRQVLGPGALGRPRGIGWRGRKEIEVSRRRESMTQEERDRSTQLSVPKMFSIAQTPTKIHRIGLGREGERRK